MALGRSSSPSESGTCRNDVDFEGGFRAGLVPRPSLSGGGASLRLTVCGALASYSTEVLRGIGIELREVDAHELFWL